MNIVTIDGMDEQDFRHSIEDMLRLGQVDEAVERLRALLGPHVGVHETLPPRFLEVSSRDVEFAGWHRLADRLCDHDRPNHPVSAIGVTLSDARVLGGPGPTRGRLSPFIKTFYFNDEAYPFSDATRDDLLDGYSRDGFEWQGDYQATDATLSIKGIDDLYGAIVELEDRLFDSIDLGETEIRAGTIGACYLAALIHQSLRETIRKKGLPRPLCVLAACDGIYPFFDAPVAGSDECTPQASAETMADEAGREEDQEDTSVDADELADDLPGMASLLSLVSRKGAKAPVMVLCEEDAEEAVRFGEMAEAQRLGVEDGRALNAALAEAHAANFAEAAAIAGELEWGDTEMLSLGAESEDLPNIAADARSGPLPDIAARLEIAPYERVFSNGNDYGAAGNADFSEHADVIPEPGEDLIAAGAEPTREYFAAPASHSLRARINMLPPELNRTPLFRINAVVDWIRRSIFRR